MYTNILDDTKYFYIYLLFISWLLENVVNIVHLKYLYILYYVDINVDNNKS